ncbi:hypothetical protein P7C71_g386, partial [Lecanoromycetidae sp. Uapishka_2]
MSQPVLSQIYTGPWINWSHGVVIGSTITLSARDGGLLTAFLALFVSVAGAACWKITSYILHQQRARKAFQDGLHHQQQIILRNTSNPPTAAYELLQLSWAWRKRADKPLRRTLPLAFLAILNFSIFGVAGIFSSEVTKAAGNETLVKSSNCGVLFGNDDAAVTGALPGLIDLNINDTAVASTYAQACYGDTGNALQCNQYTQQQIKWNTNANASCPFGDNRCYGSTSAYEMDTGKIDTDTSLGINARESKRLQFRKVTTCSPIHTLGYATEVNITDPNLIAYGDTIEEIAFGPIGGNVSNVTYTYDEHSKIDNFGYSLIPLVALAGVTSGWLPVPALNRTDADVSILFLTQNSVSYTSPVADPFFSANIVINDTVDGVTDTTYEADLYVSALACTDQYQYCNPNNGRCTSLTASNLLLPELGSLDLNAAQLATYARFVYMLNFQGLYSTVVSRGASALLASRGLEQATNTHSALPNNQWQLEVSSWFATSLAKLQQQTVNYATGPAYVPQGTTINRPTTDEETQQCKQQKIRNVTSTISFSVLGVAIILIVGAILIFTSLVIEPIFSFLRLKLHWKDHKPLQWTLDEKLQLQRLAYEESGQGVWSGGMDSVPVTRKGDRLGIPEGVDMVHPRLGRRWDQQHGAAQESMGLMGDKGMEYRTGPVDS